ncbi:head maturation protease, ClpP-related [Micromonospora sp. NPDC047620]|uniref:head maturation protease, ClpP-related n=1 Tax=Micromonospora sp. NPDC047620 TaxID=3364251 RepID=UPI003717D78A
MPEPSYRFRGRVAPSARAKTPICAEQPASDVSDGVATLRLYDPIDSWGDFWGVSAKEFVRALDEIPDVHEIRLHINSPGGEVWEGIAILNALRNHPARVVAVVDGLAASAASFIATGADEVVMGRNTELMIHDAWGLAIGNAADMRDLASRLDKISDNIASVYAAKAGGTVESWRAAMLAETWYSAEEAVAAGLADRVEGAEPDVDAKNAFDLSVFKHAGRAQAPEPVMPREDPPAPQPEPVADRIPRPDDPLVRHRNRLARTGR